MNQDSPSDDHLLLDYHHIAEMGIEVAEYMELVQDVAVEVPDHIAELDRCIRAQDRVGRNARIHQAYGMLITFGFRALAERIESLRELEAMDHAVADEWRAQLELLWQQSLAELHAAVDSGRLVSPA